MSARNMYRFRINIHEKKLCVKLIIYKKELSLNIVMVVSLPVLWVIRNTTMA